MVIQGIIFGLLAATSQSFSYIFSRIFVTRPGNRAGTLFVLSHCWMGLFALAVLPFVWNAEAACLSAYVWPLMGAVFPYMLGQLCLFRAIQRTDASRISPLLGLKILVLALITTLLFGQGLSGVQWLAVGLSVAAALALNYSGGGAMPASAVAYVMAACVGYSFSDLSIVALTRVLSPEGAFGGILLSTCLSYIVAMAITVTLAAAGPKEERAWPKWRGALPMAVAWFVAMVLLYVCFRMIGAVFGNIVQSLRGPISIFLGMAIAARGYVHLEQRVTRWTLLRRVAAALLMCLAIFLYMQERARIGAM